METDQMTGDRLEADFSETSMPDGCAVEDMPPLGLAEAARDFVSYVGYGRGKTRLSLVLGALAT